MASTVLQFVQTNGKAQLAIFEICYSLSDGIPYAHAKQQDVEKANEYLKGGDNASAIAAGQSILSSSRAKNLFTMLIGYSSFQFLPWSIYLYQLYRDNKNNSTTNTENTNILSLPSTITRVQQVGLAMNLFGIFLRSWSKWTLSRFFTYVVTLPDEHRLVQSGPYAKIRHPGYTGLLLQLCGNALYFREWYSTLFALYFTYAFVTNRIPHEEEILGKHYGDEYEEYKKRTWKLLPPIY